MVTNIDGFMLKEMFLNASNALENEKDMLNALNVFPVPDGDTGTNMSLTMKSAVKDLLENNKNDIKEITDIVSRGSLMGARGNSGVILSQLIRGMSKIISDSDEITVPVFSKALREATETAYRAVMKPTEGTILTVARGCSDAAHDIERKETDIISFMKHVIDAGNETLDRTPEMLPALKEAGVVDAGGKGYMVILDGMYSALTGESTDSSKFIREEPVIMFDTADSYDPNIEFGYCTEFIINDTNANPESFRDEIENLGDSMLVIGDEGIIKVHIHTNDPGEVLKRAVTLGGLINIKIDNMRYQHSHTSFNQTELAELDNINDNSDSLNSDSLNLNDEGLNSEPINIGVISISSGEGLKDVFDQLGVNTVISGGQTMNPSTEDILKAVESMNTDNIIILPNNSNIILAANQVKDVSEKNVEVIPTKTIPEGIAAMIDFDPDSSLEENVMNMSSAYEEVKTGQITFSVKDTVLNGKSISKGEIIGLLGKEIVCTGSEVEGVTEELVAHLYDEGIDMITIIYGEDVSEEDAEKLAAKIEELYSDADIELIYGGQPLYHYLIAAE